MRKMFFSLALLATMMIVAAGEADIKAKVTNVEFVTGFDIGKVDIQSGMMPVLDKIAKVLVTRPDATVIVEGEADASCIERLTFKESEDYNLQLSLKRAEAVKSYLIGKGVPANKIKAMGIGRVAAETRSEARGVRVQLFWIATSDIELVGLKAACQVAQAVAESAADRAVLAAADAKAAARKAEAVQMATTAQADRAETEASRAESSAILAGISAEQAKFEADRAKEEREKAEAIAKTLKEKKKDTSSSAALPALAPWVPPRWLRGVEVEANLPHYLRVGKNFSLLQLDLAKGFDRSKKWWGGALTAHLSENWDLSLIGISDKFKSEKVVIADVQANYTFYRHNRFSISGGVDYGWIQPFNPEYRNGKKIKVEGTRWFPMLKFSINWRGFSQGGLYVLDVAYSPEFCVLKSGEFNKKSESTGVDEASVSLTYRF